MALGIIQAFRDGGTWPSPGLAPCSSTHAAVLCVTLPQELEDLLPTRSEAPIVSGDAEEVDLQDYDNSQGTSGGGRREAYNDSSDEEGGHHGPGVQCAHQ